MKRCAYCGRENGEDAAHCQECGTAEFKGAPGQPPPLPALDRPAGKSREGSPPLWMPITLGLILLFFVGYTYTQRFRQAYQSVHHRFENCLIAAQNGDATAQYNLGCYYANGVEVATNLAEAARWFRKAAEQDHARAQFSLGSCYYWGRGVLKDEEEATKWFLKAAEQDLAVAQHSLGTCYFLGAGVATNDLEALKWYRKAAAQKFAPAQHSMGICYAMGRGMATNHLEAVKWFRKSAHQKHAAAQQSLGFCYAKGNGVAKNEKQALIWLRKAAQSGNAEAFNSLGWLLATSENADIRDGAKAIYFAEKAVAATQRKGANSMDTLAAAFAEAGQFEKAIRIQEEAIALLTTDAEKKKEFDQRLKLYQSRTPYRDKD